MKNRRRRFLWEWLAVSFSAVCLLATLTLSGLTDRLDYAIYDWLVRQNPLQASDEIVIVAIDDASLAELGRWPWPREHHTAFFRHMAQARPKVIGYDILFAEPTPADHDLAQAIRAAGPSFLPLRAEIPGPDGRAALFRDPTGPLAAAATGLGHVDVSFDADGEVRRIFLRESDGLRTVPHLMQALRAHMDGRAAGPPLRPARGLRRADEVLIRFHGKTGSYRTVPFGAVSRGEVPPEVFRDRIVLVGATAPGLNDRYATPMMDAGGMPGVEIQANLLQSLRDNQNLKIAGPVGELSCGLVLLAILLAGCLRLSPRSTLSLTIFLTVLAVALSGLACLVFKVWIAPAPAIITLALVFPIWSWRRLESAIGYMIQELERFRDDEDVLVEQALPSGDTLSRQLDLMALAVARMRHLRAALKAATEQRERLLALLSHDIRSPQVSIVALLKTAEPGTVAPETAEKISGLVGRTLALAENFVLLARAEAETYDLQPVNLVALLVEAADDLWPQSRLAGSPIKVLGADDELIVQGDASLLARALVNLIDNALKYGRAGAPVICAVSRTDTEAVLTITDAGRGMTETELALIGQPFQRAGEQRPGGAGLGLALVRAVVERHGGRLQHSSKPGKGTIATLALPLLDP